MPALETEDSNDGAQLPANDENRGEKTLSGPIIGIIYPPPEVRSILNLRKNILKRLQLKQTRTFLNKINFLDSVFIIIFSAQILLIKLQVSLLGMDQNSKLAFVKMSWEIRNLIS